jgi:Holliday junction DNA helicase RuvA
MQPQEIIRAIVNSDARLLEQIKGIGKKSAERLVLELKDKLSKMTVTGTTASGGSTFTASTPHQDAIQALMSLGIQKSTAEKAIDKTLQAAGDGLSVEALIKLALKNC